ncbi:MAG TPA: hypothetical protein VGS22_00630 [Thermoanaerobaculia bacterium]|nr:hypothetical protein [Thermoanaerobaculia bacterium]
MGSWDEDSSVGGRRRWAEDSERLARFMGYFNSKLARHAASKRVCTEMKIADAWFARAFREAAEYLRGR